MDGELVDELVYLAYAEAGKRVGRNDRSIRRWHGDGMPMEWRTDEVGSRFRVVEESVLLAWWWQRVISSPVHQARMRRAASGVVKHRHRSRNVYRSGHTTTSDAFARVLADLRLPRSTRTRSPHARHGGRGAGVRRT